VDNADDEKITPIGQEEKSADDERLVCTLNVLRTLSAISSTSLVMWTLNNVIICF